MYVFIESGMRRVWIKKLFPDNLFLEPKEVEKTQQEVQNLFEIVYTCVQYKIRCITNYIYTYIYL